MNQGLSSNSVNAILKDRFGLMWFGTDDGLNKFDGTNFTVYRCKPGDPGSLQANEILSLHEDEAGNLWAGTSGGSLSLYDRKKDVFSQIPANKGPGTFSNNVIRSICHDTSGNIWVAHFEGLEILDPKTKRVSPFRPFQEAVSQFPQKHAGYVFEDSRHRIWIGAAEGLFLFDGKSKSLKRYYHDPLDTSSLADDHVNAIVEDIQGNIWVGTNRGLSRLNPETGRAVNFKGGNNRLKNLSSDFIACLAVDKENIWVGTPGGLDIISSISNQITHHTTDYRNAHSLSSNSVRSLFIDNQDIYWIGTTRGGVNKYDKNLNLFNLVQSNPFDEAGLKATLVNSFAEDRNGNIYVGTEGDGLMLFDRKTRLFKRKILQNSVSGAGQPSVQSLHMTRNGQLLIGTLWDGLLVYNPVSGIYRKIQLTQNTNDRNSNFVHCIRESRNGNIWVGTNGSGVYILNKDFHVIGKLTPNPRSETDTRLPVNAYIRDFEEDQHGKIWIGTHGGGVAVFEPASQSFTIYNTANSGLKNNKIRSLLRDSRGRIWAGTFGGGLAWFDETKKQFVTLLEKDGLPNSTVHQILEDRKGMIWLSTNRGISSLDAVTGEINNYDHYNGVHEKGFVRGAGIRLSTGELFFGGTDGFNYFHPELLRKNNNKPVVLITDLRIANESVVPGEDGPLEEQVSVAKKIDLKYKQNFALSFVGINYTAPGQNQYGYKLEGFDKDWNYVGTHNSASYTNLDPGKYIFHVRARNNDGVWNNEGRAIQIVVHPPFWMTVYAYVFYILAVLGALLYIRHRGIRKLKNKFAMEQERIRAAQERREAERMHELDQLKIKFLTNLSHEFRTPISLILGPVESLIARETHVRTEDQLHMIKRNGKRLLNLVNQLLDFRKMEEHELKLHESKGELISFVRDVSDSFRDIAERKKIDYRFQSQVEQFHTVFDHDKIERILFNLLSNAFKFTLEGGKIKLALDKKEGVAIDGKTWITVKVCDDGIGIPGDKKEKIFEPFTQSTSAASILNQGSGLGLSITREFVHMHGGEIMVESEPGKGTVFTMRLPFADLDAATGEETLAQATSLATTEEPSPIAKPVEEPMENNLLTNRTEVSSILLVEDNEDFRFYLKDNLRLHYKISEAANGREGWQKALALHPQVIVSDISMPEMDGIELCRKIKQDKRTSHIPIILLTARAGDEDQLRGLETGANDYITKPFNFEVLNAKIRNLLLLNTTLKSAYSRQIKVLGPDVEIESGDEKLMAEIMLYLEENLTDPKLSVEQLSRHVGMSRSSLYSKLLELTGQTPVEFIRSVKLDKAVVLLEKSDMNIAQVAYSVGFSTPNYFAKSFKAKFNMLPSEYVSNHRRKGKENVEG